MEPINPKRWWPSSLSRLSHQVIPILPVFVYIFFMGGVVNVKPQNKERKRGKEEGMREEKRVGKGKKRKGG